MPIEGHNTVRRHEPGYFTVNVKVPELPPPGAGFVTRILAFCGVARSATAIATRSCPEFTNTVVRGEPFHSATDPGTKFAPVTVTQVLGPGEVMVEGDSDAADGLGLGTSEGGKTNAPCSKTTRPLPLPQKSLAVRNADRRHPSD
jgi:hypothetical protein